MPHVTIKIEIQMLGFMSLSTTSDGTSKIAYRKKKTVNAMLYCGPVNSRSAFMPATRALAMLLPCQWSAISLCGPLQACGRPTIEECKQVYYRENRDQSEVDLAED
jgi:hypothetical protein